MICAVFTSAAFLEYLFINDRELAQSVAVGGI